MKYKCIKAFEIPMYDECENTTNDYHAVNVGSVYEYETDYIGNSDVRMYLENGDDDFGFIDITFKRLEECFVRIE